MLHARKYRFISNRIHHRAAEVTGGLGRKTIVCTFTRITHEHRSYAAARHCNNCNTLAAAAAAAVVIK